MRIVAAAAQTIRWPIAATGAARGRSERAAILVEVRSERGAVGLGEAAPLVGMSSDSLDAARREIDHFIARPPFEVADRDAAAARAADADAPSARFAIETALLDALGREHRVSVATLLGSSATSVPLAAVVDDPADARAARAAGIRCLKLKLGATDDLARVHAIIAAAPDARLRIDANRSWPPHDVPARLAALAALPIDYVEEPCADAHQLLAGSLPCRIALDESLVELSSDQLDAALQSPHLAAVVLKPTLLGGLSAALAIACRARHHGVAAVASHGLEGPIGTAACAELALAIGGGQPAGIAPHSALDGWRIRVAQLGPAHVRRASAAGLGFDALELHGAVAAAP